MLNTLTVKKNHISVKFAILCKLCYNKYVRKLLAH